MMPNKMRAAFVVEPNKIEVRETVVPEIGPEDVLIRVAYAGICGTDLSILHGIYSAEFLPLIPGHEFVGHVVDWGAEVSGLERDQLVTADINMGCKTCYYCRQNAVLLCPEIKQVGIHIHGAFAEYVAIPADYIRVLPNDMDVASGTMIEPISCVIRAARAADLRFGKSVAILGAGSVGLLHLQMVRLCGAAPVIVVDVVKERLAIAKKFGADHTLVDNDNLVEELRNCTEGRGPDILIEATGRIESYEKVFQLVRPGGRIMAFGMPGAGQKAQFEPFQVVLAELSMTGSVAGMGEDVYDAIRLVSHGRFQLEPYTSLKIPLENIAEGFQKAENKSAIKVLIDMT